MIMLLSVRRVFPDHFVTLFMIGKTGMSISSAYHTQFILGETEYSPSELFDKYSKHQPQLVSVTQGFYGEKQTESFERGQIIYFREHLTQERVVATVLKGPRLILGKQISLPKDYGPQCFILKNGKPGKLTSTTQALPLYLHDVRVSFVIGSPNFSRYEWDKYLDLMSDICTQHIQFDRKCGQKGIALYVTDTTINPHTSDISVAIPTVYCSINDCLDDERVYEKLNEEKKPVKQEFDTYDIIPFYATEKQKTTKHDTAIPTTHPQTKYTKLHKPLPPVPSNNSTQMDTKWHSSSRLAESKEYVIKENHHKSSVTSNVMQKRVFGEGFHQQSPLLPPRQTKLSENSQQQQTGRKIPVQYEADDKGHLQPQPNADKQCTNKEDSQSIKRLNDCTVKDIGDLLVELKLDEYKTCFKELLIDGVVLNALDENTLCKECGMKTVEAIRLMAYVRKGHLVK